MKILEEQKVGHVWFFKVSGNMDNYDVEYNELTGKWKCSCPGYMYRKTCSHVDYVKRFLCLKNKKQKTLVGGEPEMKFVKGGEIEKVVEHRKCGLELLDRIYGGAFFSTDSMNAIYGNSTTGKSLLAIETAVYRISQGDKVMYIDTEGGALDLWADWKFKMAKKYGVNARDIDRNLLIVQIDSIEEMAQLLGIYLRLMVKENVVEVNMGDLLSMHCEKFLNKPRKLKECKEKHGILLLEDIIKEEGYKHLVIDSFSALIDEIPVLVQNYRTRADIIKNIYKRINKLQRAYNMTVLMIHKASKSPMAMDTRENMFGGEQIKYYSKRILYIDYPTKKYLEKYRRLWVIRATDRPHWSDVVVYRITENGFVEPSEIEVKELKKDIFTNAEDKYGARLVNTDEVLTPEDVGHEVTEEELRVKMLEEESDTSVLELEL